MKLKSTQISLLVSSLMYVCISINVLQAQAARIIVDTKGSQHPWNHLDVNNAEASFQFAIVTDRTGGHRPGVFPTAIRKLNLLQPEFVMSVGDLIEGYTEDEDRIDAEWDEFQGFISELQVPFFYLPGNHDYINEVMAKKWKERFGRNYYHFVYKDVLFLCLNSEERMRGAGKGYIGKQQYEYVKKALEENKEAKWTLLFMHQPLWDQEDSGLWSEVENLLADKKHTVFVGHRHRYVKYSRNNGKYFILATTGGGSGLRGTRFGEFDHVVWITMTEDGPIIANLLLEGIWDENVNTEEAYAISAPLMGKHPFSVAPLFVDDEVFLGGFSHIRISNDSDVPMKASIQAVSNEQVWAVFPNYEQVIPPNSVDILKLPLKTLLPLEVEDMAPVQLIAQAVYQPIDQPELSLSFDYRLKAEPLYGISSQKQAITIDGKLDEWGKLSYQITDHPHVEADPFSHQGAEDCSFSFDVSYDDQFLYLAGRVKDDQLELYEGKRAIDQDGIAFMFDARPLQHSAAASGGGIFRQIMLLGFSPVEGGQVYRPDRIAQGTQWACKVTEGGYVAEAAIPISYLNEKYGKAWQHLRLNVLVRDTDMKGMHTSLLSWQPNWSGDQNTLGSGMFKKE